MCTKLVFVAICAMQIYSVSTGHANFYIQFSEYHNADSKDQSGHYCDTVINLFWESACDIYFVIEWHPNLRFGKAGFPRTRIRTHTYVNSDHITFNSNLGNGHANPLTMSLLDYNGRMNLRVDIWDSDTTSHDKIDEINAVLTPTSPGIPGWTTDSKTTVTLQGSKSNMKLIYWAQCHQHWYGQTCNIYCIPTDNNAGHYTCNGQGQKLCLEGWLNPISSCLTRNYCHGGPCLNGGICSNGPSGFSCHCQVGYTGSRCETKLPRCNYDNPCQNMGTCHWSNTNVDQFWCTCLKGYRGTYCEQDINECLPINPCQNNGTCTNFGGGYQCNCYDRHYGKHCEKFYYPCDILPCQNNATCVNGNSTYTCHCPPGFNGTHCDNDIDECQFDNPCQNNGTCLNTPGSYQCKCSERHDGDHCEILLYPCDSSPCENGAECTNENGSYVCKCSAGFTGKNCEHDINECKVGNPCLNGAKCTNKNGSYVCKCSPGFRGRNCEQDINECQIGNPCLNGGQCVNNIGSFECTCSDTYYGKRCENVTNPCSSSPCRNGGRCKINKKTNYYECKCPQGYVGKHCQSSPSNNDRTTSGEPVARTNGIITAVSCLMILFVIAIILLVLYKRHPPTRSRFQYIINWKKRPTTMVDATYGNGVYMGNMREGRGDSVATVDTIIHGTTFGNDVYGIHIDDEEVYDEIGPRTDDRKARINGGFTMEPNATGVTPSSEDVSDNGGYSVPHCRPISRLDTTSPYDTPNDGTSTQQTIDTDNIEVKGLDGDYSMA